MEQTDPPAKVASNDQFGPLPEYAQEYRPRWPGDAGGFTAAQMRAYAAAEAAKAVADERERWRPAVVFAAHQLEKARTWSGMDWHYNPLHPLHYRSALERLRDALGA